MLLNCNCVATGAAFITLPNFSGTVVVTCLNFSAAKAVFCISSNESGSQRAAASFTSFRSGTAISSTVNENIAVFNAFSQGTTVLTASAGYNLSTKLFTQAMTESSSSPAFR